MKKYFLILLVLFSFSLNAQQQTYDVFSFTTPPNATETDGKDYKAFSFSQTGKGFLQIQLFKSINNSGDFTSEWKSLTKETKVPISQNYPLINDGWKVVNGQGLRSNNSTQFTTILYVFTKAGQTADILINTNNNQWLPIVKDFILSVKLQPNPTIIASNPPPQPLSNNLPKPTVYMYLSPGAVGFDAPSGSLEYSMFNNQKDYIIAFADGAAYFKMPEDGLQNFNVAASKAGNLNYYWGSFSIKGNGGNYKLQNNYYNKNAQLQKQNNSQWKVSGSAFLLYKCKPVDGLKLNGIWVNGKMDANQKKYYATVNCGPMIQFNSDGSFDDFGIFHTQYDANCKAYSPNDQKGKGTYSIGNYTLTLNYQDGHQKQLSFSGLLDNDLFTNNANLCVRGNIWTKQ